MPLAPTLSLPPLIVGEVLFDHFPDGKKVLGGAPFNVAWNLQGFGVPAKLLSAVGPDPDGEAILSKMKAWGMDTQGIGTAELSTGQVSVTFQNGQPTYDIVHPAAFDRIDMGDVSAFSGKHSMLYLGSLILRDEHNRRLITQLIQNTHLPRLVDINIRHPWFDTANLDLLLGNAKWVKLSDEELLELTSLSACQDSESIQQGAGELRSRFDIENVLVTAGGSGAYYVSETHFVHAPAPKPPQMVDTVGAGDAFTAATIAGLIRIAKQVGDEPSASDPTRILRDAVAFASRVCGLSGATTDDSDFYVLD